jgi:anti-sigma factor RsiW
MRQRARARRDHRWAPRRMSDYLDGELAERSRTRLERHVRECEECRGVLRGLQRMLGKLRGMTPPSARPDPRATAARVRDRLSQQPES